MTAKLAAPAITAVAGLLLFSGGCAEGPVKPDPAVVSELRSRYLLEEEPAGAITPVAWREEQESEETLDESPVTEVVLVGRIGGMPNPWPDSESAYPWRENEATFFLVDPATAAEFSGHLGEEGDDHAADCAFCARKAGDKISSVVAVTFHNEQGDPTPIDARELLGVAAGDTVVVRGMLSTLLGGDLLVLKANGIFIRE